MAAAPESPWDIAGRAADALAPESGLVADADVAQFGKALSLAARGAAANPVTAAMLFSRLALDLFSIPPAALVRLVGGKAEPPMPVDSKDRRFADPAWTDNPVFFSVRQAYLAVRRLSHDLVDSAQLDGRTAAKAQLALDLLLDAAAPTNFLPTNPAALKRAFDTGGASLVRGARHFIDDVLNNGGQPRQVDTSGFTLGGNLAATPAKVVYRNEIMELLQYEPQTPQVHSSPLLCSPPWINKYYIMDLAPGRSFIEWAVQHDRTVFAISYRNPGPEMAGVTMDDYLVHGPLDALNVIQEITGAETIDIVGLCLGGALTAITDAYLVPSETTGSAP